MKDKTAQSVTADQRDLGGSDFPDNKCDNKCELFDERQKRNGHHIDIHSTNKNENGHLKMANGKTTSPENDYETETAAVPANVVIPPDGGWGWIVVFASFCCNLVVDGIIFSFGAMLTEISETFHESKATTSLSASLLSGTYLIVGPFASALANRYGFRNVTIAGSIISSFAFILSSYATSIEFLFITYGIIGGIGFGFIFVPSIIVIGFYFEKWRALATGIAVCGAGIGTFLMAPITATIIKHYNWRAALIVQAGFLLSCAVFGSLYRPLEQAIIEVPVDKDEKKGPFQKRMSIMQTKIIANGITEKSESLLNMYEDSGLTVTNSTELYNLFNNNSKYPTAMQIFGIDKRASFAENIKKSSQSLNTALNQQFISDTLGRRSGGGVTAIANNNVVPSSQTDHQLTPQSHPNHESEKDGRIDKKETSSSDWKIDKVAKDINHAEHNNTTNSAAGNLWIPEMKILLSRKHSLYSGFKSQSFTEHTTISSIKRDSISLKTPRRNTVGRSDLRNRPLYRDDIFFNSSLKRLAQYKSHGSGVDYTMSVTRLPTYNDVMEEEKSKFNLCSESVRRVLATMLNMSLIQSPTFMLLALSGFATSMGLYVPFIYITDRATGYEISSTQTIWLISVVGIANTFGRITLGILSSLTNTNALILNNVSLTICGIVTMFSGMITTPEYQFSYAAIFGLTIACFATLRTIIVVDLLGLEKLTNAFGLLLLFQGIAAVIGPPTAGFFIDLTGSYDTSFYVAGALILLSAVMCYPVGKISRWENCRNGKNNSPVTSV